MTWRGLAGVAVGLALVVAACGPPTSGKSAEELWAENCARCHGAAGEGNPAQVGLDPKVDLTASDMVAGRARGLIYQRISFGFGAMPGFEHKLERGDVELLVDYVLRLAGEE